VFRKLIRGKGSIRSFIFLLGMIMVMGILYYAKTLVEDLRLDAHRNLTVRVEQYRLLATYSPQEVLDFTGTIDFPLVYTNQNGDPKFWKNLDLDLDSEGKVDSLQLLQLIKQMDAQHEPIPFSYDTLTDYFHYGDSELISRVQWFPVVTIIAAVFFGLIGYIGFQYIRRSEESGIWVGMARETAHQLGTPISSLMGWIELLETDPMMPEALEQMRLDTQRLEKIAYRFNKIGSKVALEPENLKVLIERVCGYFETRLSRGSRQISFVLEIDSELPRVMLNQFLFEWVIENLIKNSIDSISTTGGTISVHVYSQKNGQRVIIDFTDTGRAIDPSLKEEVFRPGYSTKKRGWGLGLSLARRIVSDYHKGRIFVLSTKPGVGITFRIILKKLEEQTVEQIRSNS
jgi:two-component system, NtrC family, sensor histidine kinase KinB